MEDDFPATSDELVIPSVDTSSPGTVSQQVQQFNELFQKSPEKFPSKKPSHPSQPWIKSKQLNPGPENLTTENNSKDPSPPILQETMAIGVVPATTSNSFTPPQIPRNSNTLHQQDLGFPVSQSSAAESSEPLPPHPAQEPNQRTAVALQVKFFESSPSPLTTSSAPMRTANLEALDNTQYSDMDASMHSQSLIEGQEALVENAPDQKLDVSSSLHGATMTNAKSPHSPSPTQSRGNSASPQSIRSPGTSRVSKFTVPQPFSLATDKRAAMNARVPEAPTTPIVKPKAGLVRASFSSPQVPPKPSPKPATEPQPFNLESVKRHEEAREKQRIEIEAKRKAEEEKRKFKASPILPKSPSPPVKSSPPTKGSSFSFASDKRAERRKEFVKMVEEKESQRSQEKKSVINKTREDLDEQLKEYRKQLTFKASPMPSFYAKSGVAKTDLSRSSTRRRSLGSKAELPVTDSPADSTRRKSAGDAVLGKMADSPKSSPSKPSPHLELTAQSNSSSSSPSAQIVE